jgi:hypothetical protein
VIDRAFGRRLAARLEELQQTEQWLATQVSRILRRRTPYHQSTAHRWLRGHVPALQTLAAIAQAVGLEPGQLAFGPRPGGPPAGA